MSTKASERERTALTLDVRGALTEGIVRLGEANVPSHTLAAELLLMHALGRGRTWLYSRPEVLLEPGQAEAYFALIARRVAGEPTQYLTGKQEFWGLGFEVNRDVLIPRPETEHVVEVALERIREGENATKGPEALSERLRIADVGTGSGCIAVALARELTDAEIFAMDISAAALQVARRNAARHAVADRINFIQCDLLRGVGSSLVTRHSPLFFDLIVSNPPYVARNDAAALAREVRDHEPHGALFGGAMGTEIYARLIEQAAALLRRGGIVVLELGYDSAPHVRELLADSRQWTSVEITNDLAGIPRVIAARKA
jgi:release factor glutamine methyltransferase